MLNRIQLVKGVGQFESASQSSNEQFSRLTLIYGENGRGKTTVSAILSSLMSGDRSLINERRRLGAVDAPHVVINGPANTALQFKDDAWTGNAPPMLVFDDAFVDANVCSGLAVATGHRQKLHELILGDQGVALNTKLRRSVERIEEHNTKLKELAAAINIAVRGDMTVDKFCALATPEDTDEQLQAAERNLAALKQSDAIQKTPSFSTLSLPDIDLDDLITLLARDIDNLSSDALAAVQSHVATLGGGGEDWLAAGMPRVVDSGVEDTCPFCAQDLSSSQLFEHLQGYFGHAYKTLKAEIAERLKAFSHSHS